ncbi:hypothetical protein [Roseivivax isoporae]|uniref:Uncharacterized protein n=1 Tax=Roseivivax isoporae LMG 25204 TaxID=1449351 RepID=X7F3A1_9RHOB|nr:hypothetical protein [Roseivivax isoporae]ETX26551.1 hypothetical protein RISW2_22870 [Roseivivax isoporae LMG 25204]
MNPRNETIAFRLWAYCHPIGWDCTLREAADALDIPIAKARAVVRSKGWANRFRASQQDGQVWGGKGWRRSSFILTTDRALEAMS